VPKLAHGRWPGDLYPPGLWAVERQFGGRDAPARKVLTPHRVTELTDVDSCEIGIPAVIGDAAVLDAVREWLQRFPR
jgi:hypothetical protein